MLLQGVVLTSFFMLEAPGWGELIPPVSSPLATLRLSSLCLARMAALAAELSSRKIVLVEQELEGPWSLIIIDRMELSHW